MLTPEPFKSEHDSYLRRYLNTGQAKIIGIGHLFHTKSSQIYELTDLPLLCGISLTG